MDQLWEFLARAWEYIPGYDWAVLGLVLMGGGHYLWDRTSSTKREAARDAELRKQIDKILNKRQ